MRGQGIPGKKDLEIAVTNEPAYMLATSRMDHGRPQHRQDLVPGGARATHSGGNLADCDAFWLFAGYGTGHELKQILPGRHVRWKNAQTLSAHDDSISL